MLARKAARNKVKRYARKVARNKASMYAKKEQGTMHVNMLEK